MSPLTAKMREIIARADLRSGTISDVPMSTLFGLARRGLVIDEPGWIERANSRGQSTSAERFPLYRGVKLTEAGLQKARSLKDTT